MLLILIPFYVISNYSLPHLWFLKGDAAHSINKREVKVTCIGLAHQYNLLLLYQSDWEYEN